MMSTGSSMDRRRFLEGAVVTAGACLGVGSARAATGADIVSPSDFAHLAVRVGDLKEAVAFYDTVLRCRPHHVASRPDAPSRGGAWCSYDIEHHRVSIFGRGGKPVPETGLLGWDRFTFSYDSLTELGANYHALKAGGIEPRAARRYGGSVSLLYTDPSGNRIEMLLDRFDRIEDLEPYLGEAAGLEKAAGVDFDPASLPAPGGAASAENETVAPSELVHTVIRTRQLEPMVDWYVRALGCEVAERSETLALLRFDHRLLRILLVEDRKRERGAGNQGYDHFAFEYKTMDELVVRTYARLKESGVKPYWCTNHGMTTSIYYTDPDGNRVETQVDNFPTKAEGLAYIRGPDFARNPVGIDFDPDEMVDRVRGGASYEEMHHRVEGPRTTPPPRPQEGVHY
ncbi:MAG: hypothetical protein F4230_08055 [Holophagales bacterium]|nr:hypothetical protein [Holophagales bacterium]MYF04916.1 hypothetical protein [Holophagales bacterium]MYJ26904.1 hypothetical protein [Holophagales bacterium]